MADLIVLKDVYKIYKMGDEKIRALNGVSLTVEEDEFLCLLGTSGSGKSTLLNMIAGLEKPTKGEISIAGKKVHLMNEEQLAKFRQENIGFVFQSYNLIPTLSALENVSLGLTFQGVAKKERERLAMKMLKGVGLGSRMHHKPSEMSGGQQQRVSIARAFVGTPKIVFADEPTGNLDTRTTYEIMDLITGMCREHKQTLVMVTHDEETAEYANTIVRMRDGKIEEIIKNEDIITSSKERGIII